MQHIQEKLSNTCGMPTKLDDRHVFALVPHTLSCESPSQIRNGHVGTQRTVMTPLQRSSEGK